MLIGKPLPKLCVLLPQLNRYRKRIADWYNGTQYYPVEGQRDRKFKDHHPKLSARLLEFEVFSETFSNLANAMQNAATDFARAVENNHPVINSWAQHEIYINSIKSGAINFLQSAQLMLQLIQNVITQATKMLRIPADTEKNIVNYQGSFGVVKKRDIDPISTNDIAFDKPLFTQLQQTLNKIGVYTVDLTTAIDQTAAEQEVAVANSSAQTTPSSERQEQTASLGLQLIRALEQQLQTLSKRTEEAAKSKSPEPKQKKPKSPPPQAANHNHNAWSRLAGYPEFSRLKQRQLALQQAIDAYKTPGNIDAIEIDCAMREHISVIIDCIYPSEKHQESGSGEVTTSIQPTRLARLTHKLLPNRDWARKIRNGLTKQLPYAEQNLKELYQLANYINKRLQQINNAAQSGVATAFGLFGSTI